MQEGVAWQSMSSAMSFIGVLGDRCVDGAVALFYPRARRAQAQDGAGGHEPPPVGKSVCASNRSDPRGRRGTTGMTVIRSAKRGSLIKGCVTPEG